MTSTTAQHMDAALPLETRVNALLSQMTLDEKIAQLGSYWVYEVQEGAAFSPPKAEKLIHDGIGHITRLGGASNGLPADNAALANTIQKYLIENTRLGIPAVIHEECCSGYMARGATVFPQAIGVASAWDPELVEAMADVVRVQMRSVGTHHALSPVLDVARDARWGRVEETFGEDPYLVTRLGAAFVHGIQSDDLANGIVATAKHFVGYSVSEGGLNWAPAHIGQRELREVFLLPFEGAIHEAGLGSVMCAYHELDGIPCSSSEELLTDVLRDEWRFDGTVVSDYFSIDMLMKYHHTAASKAEAAAMALQAGVDIELPFTDCYGAPLRKAVLAGKVSEAQIDTAVRRVLAQKFTLGLFENPYVNPDAVHFDTPEQRQLARQIAHKSIVLLKNTGGVLPLNNSLESIAVIGPNADSVRNLFGDYTYPAHIETILESKFNNSFDNPLPGELHSIEDFIPAISVRAAVQAKVGANVQVHYAKGCEVRDTSTEGFAEAVAAASKAQVAVVVVGDKAGLTDECTSGEARDRAVLTLPGVQEQLVSAVCATGTPVILVLVNGRPVALDGIIDQVAAVVEAWFPSEEGANALVDVLFGDVNPGGKLPITFPHTAGQMPVFYGHRPSGGRSHWKVDYVETSVQPLYPFGYGLSYTQFAFDNFRIETPVVDASGTVTIHVDVTNAGDRAGDEVVQLYTHQTVPGITRPVQELKGFKRVTVEPGQTRTVTFRLPVSQLCFYDGAMNLVVHPGIVDVMVGSSSQDIHGRSTFEITGEKTTLASRQAFFSAAEVS